ncbi:MAG TPA: ATP-binding protein [Gammaproteobacteria bacterium]|nr:ATP-binding protein [Gammaproteobacteria bacterium]
MLQQFRKTLLPSAGTQPEIRPWYPVRLLGLYRLFIAILLCALFFSGVAEEELGAVNRQLFANCAALYTGLAILWLLLIHLRTPDYQIQVYAQIAIDILLLGLMMRASGGSGSGLGILLLVHIGAAVLLLGGLAGLLFASFASALILIDQIYTHLTTGIPGSPYSKVAALCAVFFSTAVLLEILQRRIRESELLAEQRGLDIENLAQLNEQIIQQMQSGVIVADHDKQIRLINRAARLQLGDRNHDVPFALEALSNELAIRYHIWHDNPRRKPSRIRLPGSPFELQPHFTPLGPAGGAGTLIILEDATPYSRESQNIKLASLGRLTASIAHEIRNPLSAIQHASQLLGESDALESKDKRLSEIIAQQCERMNTVIENIMQLSLKEKITPDTIALFKWLLDFKKEFCGHYNLAESDITVHTEPDIDEPIIYFDPSQLHQIVWNLCANSLKYGKDKKGKTRLKLTIGFSRDGNSHYLDVIDHGPGVPAEIQDQIFEPFFSSSNTSPGLGLYIVRELCEFNQAHIRYVPSRRVGAVFRIQFSNSIPG